MGRCALSCFAIFGLRTSVDLERPRTRRLCNATSEIIKNVKFKRDPLGYPALANMFSACPTRTVLASAAL